MEGLNILGAGVEGSFDSYALEMTITDSVVLSEVISKGAGQTISESINMTTVVLSEVIPILTSRTLSDTMTMTDDITTYHWSSKADTYTNKRDCDICGFTFQESKLKKDYRGRLVCIYDFEERHPLDERRT